MQKAQVRLSGRNYAILIGRNFLPDTPRFLRQSGVTGKNVLLVSQKEIAARYGEDLTLALEKDGYAVSWFTTPGLKNSEATKSQSTLARLIKKIASLDGKNSSPFLIALGGGVVGDLTGFAASIYRRGIPYIQIPTTLTAQVDSAIGGKTAVDLPEGKNLLGSIYQPALVLSDMSVLQSLPERHWSDGCAEVIKYGVIKDPALFKILEKNGLQGLKSNAALLENVIYRCAKIKAQIVEKDEFDQKDLRIVLNFGHTAGHAIEKVAGFSSRYTHGEAVSIGMLVACDIAKALGILKEAQLITRLESTLIKFNLPLYFKNLQVDKLLEAIGYDKKSKEGVSRFVLPVGFGHMTVVRDIPSAAIAQALKNRQD